MNKYTKNQIWFNLEKIISIITALAIIITTAVMMSSCVSTQSVHINDIYKHKKSNLYNECYTFIKK